MAPALTRLVALIRLGRPLFLGGGFILFGLGAAIARLNGHAIDGGRYALGQAAVTAFQLMTHYANDYFDFAADRANATPTQWSGGSRVLANDELPRGVALVAALVLAAIGCVLGALLYLRTEDVRVGLTLVAMAVLAWEYSAPPFRLCAAGLGELDTAVVVTALVPLLGFLLQAPDLAGARVLGLALVPLVLLQFAMLVAIEFPDAAGDAATAKRTLVVRMGAPAAAKLWIAVTVAAFAWLPVGYLLGLPGRIALITALPAPFAAWRIARVADHRDPTTFERLTFGAVALLVATSACELAATLWATV
ncbi:MAG: prenyltransferase [Deltaproteobacteria bacterium]